MKHTTKKILLWLYQTDKETKSLVQARQLRLLLPELKDSGFRSLINLLKKQHLISQEEEKGLPAYRLTSYGESLLEAQFPIFSDSMNDWAGEWTIVVFLSAPKSDKQFRYLRRYLVNENCGQLSRGVYLFPGKLPENINKLLFKLYVGSVLVTGMSKWVFGDERSLINNLFGLSDLKTTYSGISKEIDQLLKQKNRAKGFESGDISTVCLVFDRLINSLKFDLGLVHYYYSESKSGRELLKQLQMLF